MPRAALAFLFRPVSLQLVGERVNADTRARLVATQKGGKRGSQRPSIRTYVLSCTPTLFLPFIRSKQVRERARGRERAKKRERPGGEKESERDERARVRDEAKGGDDRSRTASSVLTGAVRSAREKESARPRVVEMEESRGRGEPRRP